MGSGVLKPLALLEPTIRTRDHRRAGDRDRTGMARLEDCAHCAVRGLDLRSGPVMVTRYWTVVYRG